MKPSRRRRLVFSLVTLAVTGAALSWSLSREAAPAGYRVQRVGTIF